MSKLAPLLLALPLALAACSESGGAGQSDAQVAEDVASDGPVADPDPDRDGDYGLDDGGALDADADGGGPPRDCFAPLDPPRWSTCVGALHDPQGRRVRLRGVNVSQPRKLSPYAGGTTPDDLAAMRALGLNHVRLLWSWAAAMPERDVLDTVYLDRLAGEVEALGTAGLLVVLDAHQDLFGEAIRAGERAVGNGAPAWACPDAIASQFEEPVTPWFANYSQPAVQGCFDNLLADPALQEAFATAWAAVAARVGELDGVVGYDLWNEPFWGTHNVNTWEVEHLLPLYERLAAALLAADPDALLFVEPGAQKNVLGFSNLTRLDVPELVYAPHLYDVAMESGEPWSGSTAAFARRLSADRAEAEALGAALYIGEWGTLGGLAGDDAFTAAVDALLDDVGVGWAVWQWGPGGPASYALIDAEGDWAPHALALARPWLSAVAGDEANVALDLEARRVSAAWTARTSAAPTELIVPEGWFEGPFSVAVEGGVQVASPPDRVWVRADSSGARVTLTLTPTP